MIHMMIPATKKSGKMIPKKSGMTIPATKKRLFHTVLWASR